MGDTHIYEDAAPVFMHIMGLSHIYNNTPVYTKERRQCLYVVYILKMNVNPIRNPLSIVRSSYVPSCRPLTETYTIKTLW